jgi:D-serine deaminase-like pyridoxal phosphate-dependent protein
VARSHIAHRQFERRSFVKKIFELVRGDLCGVEPGEPALALTRAVAGRRTSPSPDCRPYHGSAQHLRGWDERRQAITQAVDKAGRTRDLLARHGIACLTGTGTGSFEFEAANHDREGGPFTTFEPSLYLWATVMSRPAEDRTIVDAGLKALAFDTRPPLLCDEPATTYERGSNEHGRLAVSAATNRLGLGDKIRLIPCEPTVNLYDWHVCVRGNRVEQIWPSPPGAQFIDAYARPLSWRTILIGWTNDEQQSEYLTDVTVRRTHPCRPLSRGALDAEWALYLVYE